MLAGGIVLVAGVRVAGLSSFIALPTAAVVATAGATWRESQQPTATRTAQKIINQELKAIRDTAWTVADRANSLKLEAENLLPSSSQIELLSAVQYSCDRAAELPEKVEEMAFRLESSEAVLSLEQLQQQQEEVQAKLEKSSGIARQQLSQLATSLQRNIQLAQEGQDTRQAQIVNLLTLIQDAAGVLQKLQNKLRASDLADSDQVSELRQLSEELNSVQESVDILVVQPA